MQGLSRFFAIKARSIRIPLQLVLLLSFWLIPLTVNKTKLQAVLLLQLQIILLHQLCLLEYLVILPL
ncbi:hypothetical protein PS15m_011577 [Mucor circinelloides]